MANANLKQGKVCKSPLSMALAQHLRSVEQLEEEKNKVAERQCAADRGQSFAAPYKFVNINNDYYTHSVGILDGRDQGYVTIDNPVK